MHICSASSELDENDDTIKMALLASFFFRSLGAFGELFLNLYLSGINLSYTWIVPLFQNLHMYMVLNLP